MENLSNDVTAQAGITDDGTDDNPIENPFKDSLNDLDYSPPAAGHCLSSGVLDRSQSSAAHVSNDAASKVDKPPSTQRLLC